MSELAKALAKAQSEFPAIERSKTVSVKTKTGGTYTFAYAPLDVILALVRPALTKNGLALSQLLSEQGGRPALRTVLLHADGETLEETCPMPMSPNGAMGPQEFGALVSYMRRYAAVSILGIATEEEQDEQVLADEKNGKDEETPFKAPTGKRGAKVDEIQVAHLANELRLLVNELGATDSLAAIDEKELAGDKDWFERQIVSAKKHLADKVPA